MALYLRNVQHILLHIALHHAVYHRQLHIPAIGEGHVGSVSITSAFTFLAPAGAWILKLSAVMGFFRCMVFSTQGSCAAVS